MMSDIQHIGHAGFTFRHGSVRLTMDPWFYPALFESWFPYPGNRHLISEAAECNWIYVSHHHQDHFDEKFLRKHLQEGTSVIVPKFRSRRMERLWKRIGISLDLHVLDHGESLQLSDSVRVTMLLDRGYREDSSLLIDAGGNRFLNMNDCDLARSDIPNQVDVLAAQYSGATHYPHCYSYDYETYRRKAVQVRKNVFARIVDKLALSGANSYLPSAGPPAFCDPVLKKFNGDQPYGIVFPQWSNEHTRILKSHRVGVHPYLGQGLAIDPAKFRSSKLNKPLWKAYYQRDDTPVSATELDDYFRKLIRGNSRLLNNYRRNIVVAANGTFQVNLSIIAAELEEAPEPHYWIEVPNRVLRAIVNGTETWEAALSSLRCKLRREPDVYDSTLMVLLTCGDEPAITRAYKQGTQSNEMTTKAGFEFQRWCPHAGEDMNYAKVEDGKITCARHEWCWDANTGECLTGQGVPLKVRKP